MENTVSAQTRRLFEAALDLEPAARSAFLATATDDSALRLAVARMLDELEAAGDFLETPVILTDTLNPALSLLTHDAAGQQIGVYRLLKRLGYGGMSEVYLAERADDLYHKRVAIKLVWTGGQSTEMARRFDRERRILAVLEHPHIARLLDGGQTETGQPYLVMEYVDGQPLTEYCRARQLPLGQRLALFQQICEAVQYAHQHLIVHRDLKPGNIFVTGAGVVKLLDFGIAKLLKPSPSDGAAAAEPSTLLHFATPEYASPEHLRGERITTASDVYSLGVLLYELLTGERPYQFPARSLPAVLRVLETANPQRPSQIVYRRTATLEAIPEPPKRLARLLQGDLDNIVLKALQKEPRQRYAAPQELCEDLSRHLNGEPVRAREATWRYRFGKQVQRNKALTAGLLLAAFILLGGLFISRQQLRASRSRERQQRYELYAANMRQASTDWGEGNLVQMDELLEHHRPGNKVDDEWRGLEWFVLWKLLHTEKFILRHQASTPTVVFTPDGHTLLTGSLNGISEKWDAYDGQARGLFANFPAGFFQLRFFSSGTRLIVNSGTRGLSIWDYHAQRKLIEVATAAPNFSGSLFFAFSPDETKLLTSNEGQPFKLWDATTGQLLESFAVPAGMVSPPPDLGPAIYSPDGRPLCLLKRDGHFELWDLAARHSVVQLDPESDDPRALQPFRPVGHLLSKDGTRYYLPTEDFRIRVWDFKRGGKPLQVLVGHEYHVETPALSHDGKLLASGSNDRTLRLWDTQTGKLLVTLKNESQTFGPVFSPDDKYLAAVSMRALRTKVWDVASLLAVPQVLNRVQTLGLSSKGHILTYGHGMGLSLRDWQTGQSLLTFTNASFTPCRSYDCERFSAAGNLVAVPKDFQPGISGSVIIRDSTTGKIRAELGGHTGGIWAVGFSPNDKLAATGGYGDGLIKLWDTATWRELATLHGHDLGQITSLDFAPDGSKLASSSTDTTVKVWDVARGKELFTVGNRNSWMLKTRFSPDGKWIATSDMNFAIKLWDATTGQLHNTLKGHANTVYCLAFSPDGKRLASGSDDKTVRLWDLQTGMELAALRGHTSEVWHLFFTPDGQTLISSGEDGTRIWRTASLAEVQQYR